MARTDRPIVVFLGPSLEKHRAEAILDAIYLPPAEQGSVYDAVTTLEPSAIVLIDGAFGHVPAVRHKEILYALSRGVAVHGAASMGAIRAAELWPYGMIGHGVIYRWFRRTPLLDDDEVAVAMAPAELGSDALGVALVDMRVTLRRAERAGVIGRELRRKLEAIAERMQFTERSYGNLLAVARRELAAVVRRAIEAFGAYASRHAVTLKAADAECALAVLASSDPNILHLPPHAMTSLRFEMSESWEIDLAVSGRGLSQTVLP